MQTSGVTSNDFTNAVDYTVTAEDATTTKVYEVTVTVSAPVSPVFSETSEEATQRQKIKTIYDALMAYYDGNASNVIDGAANQYDTAPGFTADASGNRTYTVGIYKQTFKDYMLQWWKFYKAIAQRPDPSHRDDDANIAEKAALVMSSNRGISHTPSKPKDMAQATFDDGYKGGEKSNLFGASDKYWFHETVQFNFTEGKVKDNLGSGVRIPSISYMGHRWNGLWRRAASAGFGYNYFNRYLTSVFRVVGNRNSNSGFQNFSAFPHGYYPIQAEMKVNNSRSAATLFKKVYPGGFAQDNTFGSGFHTIWTIQQVSTHTFTSGSPITVTIRDTDSTGGIIDQLTCNVGEEVKKSNGSFLRIKYSAYAGGWCFTIKPKDGVLSGAVQAVLNKNVKKVFHITLSGNGITAKIGSPADITYRIIYYDIDN